MAPPVLQKEEEMWKVSVFLPVIVVILEVKVKIIRKGSTRKSR